MATTKKPKEWKPDKPITVDRDEFDAAMDRLLKAKPTPQKKVKANKKQVPQPLFPPKP